MDRRIVRPLRPGEVVPYSPDVLVVSVPMPRAGLKPSDRARRVEEVYAEVPISQRQAAGLTYEHVRLVLAALEE